MNGWRARASGRFAAHGAALARAGAEPVYVRERGQFRSIDGLVIPGVKAPLSSSCFTATG